MRVLALLLVVLAAATGVILALRDEADRGATPPPGPYLPEHPREVLIDFLTRLDEAEVEADEEYHPENKVWGDRFVNTDDEFTPLLVLPRMALRFREVPIHPGAKLSYVFGPNKVLYDGARGRVQFRVMLEIDGERHSLHRQVVDPADPAARERGVLDLSAWAGRRVDLSFETSPRDEEVSAWPAWLELKLRSEGRPATPEDAMQVIDQDAGSLLGLFDAGDAEVLEQNEDRPLRRISLLRASEDDAGPVLRAAPPSRARFVVAVPDGGGRIDLSVGLDPRARDRWAPVRFTVQAGDEVLFEEVCDPPDDDLAGGRVSAKIDLGRWAGEDCELTLATAALTEAEGPIPALWIHPHRVDHRRLARSAHAPDAPNVLVLLVDTLRADRLGCYGNPRDTSPNLDALAAESARFERAISQSSWTLPSTASLFTSQYPLGHGVVSEELTYLHEDLDTLAEHLAEAGLSTAAFVGNLLVSRASNFHQGFETYQSLSWANARKLNRRLLDWIDDHRGDRFFGYVHYVDPHDPYTAPVADAERFGNPDNPFAGLDDKQTLHALGVLLEGKADWDSPHLRDAAQHMLDRYDSEIHYWDRSLGELIRGLKERGLWDETIVVVTSDHGEEFFEHRRYYHTQQLYEESIHVPLIVRDPRREPAVLDRPVEVLDVKPTLLAMLDLPADDEDRGQDLFSEREYETVFSSTELGAKHGIEGHLVLHAVRQGRWKLIEMPSQQRAELFDLQRDRRETNDLGAKEAAQVEAMRKALAEWVRRSVRPDLEGRSGLDADALERMQALGYLDRARNPTEGKDEAPSKDAEDDGSSDADDEEGAP